MGAVVVRKAIYEAMMAAAPENTIELFHGYTYSGHPLAAAAALASLDVFEEEELFKRAGELAPYFEDAVHSLREMPHVIDVRNLGMVAGIELEPIPGKPTARAFEAFQRCYEKGVLIRTTGDIIALSPPLIISKPQIDELVGTLGGVLREMGRTGFHTRSRRCISRLPSLTRQWSIHSAVSFSCTEFCRRRWLSAPQSTQSSGWSWLKHENT